MSKLMLIAPCLLMLSACSTTRLPEQTPPLPGNLSAKCPKLPSPPVPLLDPARLEWELALITLYGQCAAKQATGD